MHTSARLSQESEILVAHSLHARNAAGSLGARLPAGSGLRAPAKLCRVNRDEGSEESLQPFGGDRPAREHESVELRPLREESRWPLREETRSPLREEQRSRDRRERGPRAESRVEEAPPPLVPRGAGEILDLALEIIRDRFAVIVGTCVALWIPVRLLEPFIGSNTWQDRQDSLGPAASAIFLILSLGLTLFLQILVQALSTAVVARLVYATIHGDPTPVRAALVEAARRALGLIVIAIVTGLATTAGCCLLFVPYVYLSWKLALAPSAYVLEGVDVGGSFTRSFALTPGCFVRWLVVMCVLLCLNGPFTGLVAGTANPNVRSFLIEHLSISSGVLDAILVVLSSIFMGLTTAIGTVAMTLLYFDCRVRREGYDLRRELAAMSARPDAPAQAAGSSA
jgi:hypothetical protein